MNKIRGLENIKIKREPVKKVIKEIHSGIQRVFILRESSYRYENKGGLPKNGGVVEFAIILHDKKLVAKISKFRNPDLIILFKRLMKKCPMNFATFSEYLYRELLYFVDGGVWNPQDILSHLNIKYFVKDLDEIFSNRVRARKYTRPEMKRI